MTFAADSPLVSRVVPTASSEQGPRPGGAADIRGIVVHMAEGGGTVSWLTRADGNSSHYVVEYGGSIVQMVEELHWAGSINPRIIRLTDDPPYVFLGETIVYGRRAQVAALGAAAADPNRYVIAIETEGFASAGPNAAERRALANLIADIRRRRGPLPVLGHRDFQSEKACPGHKVPWVDYGGHAVKVAEGSSVNSFSVPEQRTLAAVKTGAWLYDNSGLASSPNNIQISPGRELVYVGQISSAVKIVAYETAAGDTNATSTAMYTPATNITGYRVPTAPPPDCTAAVATATAALETQVAQATAQLEQARQLGVELQQRLRSIHDLTGV